MTRSESPSITVSRRGAASEQEGQTTVIWVRGEHDITTKVALVVAIARAAERRTPHVVVDLSGVTFMDASTIGAIVGSRKGLASRSQLLAVRAPSPNALRLLQLCDLTGLIQAAGVEAVHPLGAGAALGTWIHVPREGSDDPEALTLGEDRQPMRAGDPLASARPSTARGATEVGLGAP